MLCMLMSSWKRGCCISLISGSSRRTRVERAALSSSLCWSFVVPFCPSVLWSPASLITPLSGLSPMAAARIAFAAAAVSDEAAADAVADADVEVIVGPLLATCAGVTNLRFWPRKSDRCSKYPLGTGVTYEPQKTPTSKPVGPLGGESSRQAALRSSRSW